MSDTDFKKWLTLPKVALLKLHANVRNNCQHCFLKNVRSLLDSVGSGVQMDATTPNNVRVVQYTRTVTVRISHVSIRTDRTVSHCALM